MSITNDTGTPVRVVPLTFKERLAQRRRELESDATFELEVPGYEDLWARYRVLGYEEIRGIGLRVEDETDDTVTAERLTAAGTLAEACIELLEFKGTDDNNKPIFESTGGKWSASTVREYFEINLPDGVAAREAVLAVFPYPRDLLMMTHSQEYLEEAMEYVPKLERVMQGESRGATAPTTSGSLRQQR